MQTDKFRAWASLTSEHKHDAVYSEDEIQQEIQTQQMMQKGLKKPRIGLFGKSTLVNNMFRFSLPTLAKTGKGMPITAHTDKYEMDDIGIIIYDTKGVELKDFEPFHKDTMQMITSMQKQPNLEDQLHCAWWLISAAGGRIEQSEIDMLNEMKQHLPVFVILTMCDLVAREADINEIKKHIPEGIKVFTIINQQEKEQKVEAMFKAKRCPYEDCGSDDIGFRNKFNCWGCFGCNRQWSQPQIKNQILELEAETRKVLPQVVRSAWDRSQQVMIKRKFSLSVALIPQFVAAAGFIGWSPVPFSDAFLLVPLQTTMFISLGVIWGLPMKKYTKFIMAHTAMQSLITFTGVGLANMLKLVPGAGTLAGCVVEAGVASVLTAALGIGYTLGFSKIWKAVWSRESLENLPTDELNKLMGEALAPQNIKEFISAYKAATGTTEEKLATVLRHNGIDFEVLSDDDD